MGRTEHLAEMCHGEVPWIPRELELSVSRGRPHLTASQRALVLRSYPLFILGGFDVSESAAGRRLVVFAVIKRSHVAAELSAPTENSLGQLFRKWCG
ncbi:unnamed protein product, partial [Iphiclides podalirius]